MDGLNVVRLKKPAPVPFWLDQKYDRYDFACLFLHGLRYDRYDLRFFRRDQKGEWMDPLARKIWEAVISDEVDPPPPRKPIWPKWVEQLFWLVVVRRLLSEDLDWVRPWLEESLSR